MNYKKISSLESKDLFGVIKNLSYLLIFLGLAIFVGYYLDITNEAIKSLQEQNALNPGSYDPSIISKLWTIFTAFLFLELGLLVSVLYNLYKIHWTFSAY